MNCRFLSTGLVAALLCGVSAAYGQQATERHIPLGQSPGLSRSHTDIGPIESVDARAQTVTVGTPTGSRSVTATGRTRIWLDLSAFGLTSRTGAFADLRVGRTIEVKYRDPARRAFADWIKVAPPTPD